MTSERLKTRAAQVALLCLVAVFVLSVQNFFTERSQGRETSIASCRAQFRTDVDDANAEMFALILDGLTATFTGDEDLGAEVVAQANGVDGEPGAKDRYVEATRSYELASDLAVADPNRFLAECKERG